MERSETLKRLRGEGQHHSHHHSHKYHGDVKVKPGYKPAGDSEDLWDHRHERFPGYFIKSTPENAQKIILGCLNPNPAKRPTAAELLKVS